MPYLGTDFNRETALTHMWSIREQLATPLHPSVVETLEWLFPRQWQALGGEIEFLRRR